ncbi:MAG: formylglycine-generating enzyme family protein [Nitrospinae bacterium]|nr:formylglycine-generating enzyme family protein [Nitrospinota bacterium]
MKKYGILLVIFFFYSISPQVVSGEDMVFVKGGCFQMGDTFVDAESKNRESKEKPVHKEGDEKPVHEVCVDDFYIGKYEVTVGEFREFLNTTGYMTEDEIGDGCFVFVGREWKKDKNRNWRNPGFLQDDTHPVCCVSWNDAVAYAEWFSGKLAPAGSKQGTGLSSQAISGEKRYRLPTEAEWEYAARSGGKREKYSGGDDLDSVAWYANNSGSKTHPVGQKNPNVLGLYDMTGNLWEWCSDWYDEKYYSNSPKDNPKGAVSGIYHVLRGGSWYNVSHRLGTFVRAQREPEKRADGSGFRLAASVK